MRHLFEAAHRTLVESQKLIIIIQVVTHDLRKLGKPEEAGKIFSLIHKASPSVNPFKTQFKKPHWARPKPKVKALPKPDVKLKPGQTLSADGMWIVEEKKLD